MVSETNSEVVDEMKSKTALAHAMDEAAERGVSAARIMDRFGISMHTLQSWRLGRRKPDVVQAVELASMLGTTVEALWPPQAQAQ